MAFVVHTNRLPDHTHIQVFGTNSLKDFVDLIQSMAEESSMWKDRCVLVDLRGLQGTLEPTEQIFVGELVAQQLSHLHRIASVVPPEQITRNSERAATELGMQLRVFTDGAEALAWLRSA